MFILLYAAPAMFNVRHDMTTSDALRNDDGTPSGKLIHYTMLFQTFVLMNLFNMFNCRKIGSAEDPEFNVFERLHSNWWFLIVFFTELNIQYFMVGYSWTGLVF